MVEYEACILGPIPVIEHRLKTLKVYGDSTLVIYQLRGEWEMKYPKLVLKLIKEFEVVTFYYFLREKNQMVDALGTLAASFKVNKHSNMTPIEMQAYEYPVHYYSIEEEDDKNIWYYDILQYIRYQSYPEQETDNDKRTIRRMVVGYVLDGKILYKKSHDQVLLRCVDAKEAKTIIEEIH
ncbi:uncharacterized protein LOC120205482 [Hibiscus syriacus]|uniref:uncharacterized protein LOC120205482 n=1 Tax=Hibiscus syriacus TaxID=106335 RepID=UPI001924BBA0|nr:uncharacterized protein LOC120205482 [Hibiscus syriacus]